MSRFEDDYYEEDFPNQGALWWANTERALRGRKGQQVLRDLRAAMVELPEPKLIEGRLADEQGGVCAVGALVLSRRTAKGESRADVLRELASRLAPDEYGDLDVDGEGADITASVGVSVGVTYNLAWKLATVNDETFGGADPDERFKGVLRWIDSVLSSEPAGDSAAGGGTER